MKKYYKYVAIILMTTLAAAVVLAAAGCSSPFSGRDDSPRQELEILEAQLEELREQNRLLQEQLESAEDQLARWKEAYAELEEDKIYWQEKFRETREGNGDEEGGEEAAPSGDSSDSSGGADRPGAGAGPSANGEVVYLTFDDGPSKNTLKILDILQEYGIKATFFVIGNNQSGDSGIYRRILAEGHALGNHTYTHNFHEIYRSPAAFMEDFLRMEQYILKQTGMKTDIMRFPGGSSSAMAQEVSTYNIIVEDLISKVENRGYDYFDWNVSTGDGSGDLSSEEIIDNALEGAGRVDGDLVVLFHDSENRHTTVEALPAIIETYKTWGYRFDVLNKGAVEVKHR